MDTANRPAHLNPALLAIVFVGGVLGTLARWGLARGLPARHGWPLGTLAANLAGAFCLGLLLEALSRRGPDEGTARVVRLGLGTGFLGAFTTMSTLATETFLLADGHHAGQALGYLCGSLLGGAVLAWLGVMTGGALVPTATAQQGTTR